jgi:hypothetical protein
MFFSVFFQRLFEVLKSFEEEKTWTEKHPQVQLNMTNNIMITIKLKSLQSSICNWRWKSKKNQIMILPKILFVWWVKESFAGKYSFYKEDTLFKKKMLKLFVALTRGYLQNF